MIALLRAELRRALSRRFVRVLIGLALVTIVFAGVMVFSHTEKFDSPARASVPAPSSKSTSGVA